MQDKGRSVTFLVFEFGIQILMPLHRADPALFRTDHGDRLTLHKNLRGIKVDLRCLGTISTAAVNLDKACLHLADFGGDPLPLQRLIANKHSKLLALGDQAVTLGLQCHFLKPPQRAQSHVEYRRCLRVGQGKPFNKPDARVVRLTDDGDHLVKIEEDHEIAFQYLKPRRNLTQPEIRTSDENHTTVCQPRIQRLAKRHHAGAPVGIKNVQVQRHPAFKVGQFEQAFHHHLGLEAP